MGSFNSKQHILMRFISSKVHGVLDYLSGALFIASPWLFGFADGGPAQWVPVLVGAMILVASLMTDYELGVVKVVSMPLHLTLDVLSGLFLAASPWIFGFADSVYLPHVVFGLLEIGAGLMTHKVAYDTHSPVQTTRM